MSQPVTPPANFAVAEAPQLQSDNLRLATLLFWAAFAFATTLFLYTVQKPLDSLLSIVPDDTFYYLTTARNIAHRNLSSFDGINLTNGYHPGWMAMMVLCAKLFGDPTTLVRAALVVAFGFHLGSAFFLKAALARWVTEAWAWVGGALWLLNPLPVNFALEGMEGCLYIFALTVALWVYSTRIAPRLAGSPSAPPSLGDFALMGGSLGLCFYGRTEAVVLAGGVILAIGWMLRRSRWFSAMLVMGGVLALEMAVWFLYSHLATGSWFQHSGSMKMLWAAEGSAKSTTRIADTLSYVFGNWAAYPVLGIPGGRWSNQRGLLAGALTAWLVWLMVKGWRRSETRATAAAGLFLTALTLLTGFVYALFFSEQQYWYKAQPSLVLFTVLYVTCVLAATHASWALARAKRVAAAAVAVMTLTLMGRVASLNSYSWQKDVLASQLKFDEIVPEGEVIGCFNAGIPGFFGKRTVVNLDGLMNNPIYEYYRAREFDKYLADAKIHYIADEEVALHRGLNFVQHPVQLNVVDTVPLPGWVSGRRYLWRVGHP